MIRSRILGSLLCWAEDSSKSSIWSCELAPESWWLWTAGILLVFNVLLANLAPVLLFPIFYKFTPLEDEYQDLTERLLDLAKKSGTHVAGVYRFDMSKRTKAANAGLTGLGNTRRIILGDTLLDEFQMDEIETVLAHELGHQKNHDIPLGMIFQTILTLGGLYLTSLGLIWGVSVSSVLVRVRYRCFASFRPLFGSLWIINYANQQCLQPLERKSGR